MRETADNIGILPERDLNVHLIDGTYELFRHFYGLRRFTKKDRPLGAVLRVLNTVLEMIEAGATHLGVATDHVIEAVERKFGVPPELIPDYLALVGDSADGYPGLDGIGPKGAASLLLRHGRIEQFPNDTLGQRRDLALLFKQWWPFPVDPLLHRWAAPLVVGVVGEALGHWIAVGDQALEHHREIDVGDGPDTE